jgi:hypothetical protein
MASKAYTESRYYRRSGKGEAERRLPLSKAVTRYRQQFPPHSFDWFRNLITFFESRLEFPTSTRDTQSDASR